MPEKIILNSGLKEFELVFEDRDNESVIIKFNPTDLNLPSRFLKFMENVQERLKGIKDIELDEDGLPKDDAYLEDIQIIDSTFREELDTAMGNRISDSVFKYNHPLSQISGESYIEQFCRQLAPIIQRYAEKDSGRTIDSEKLDRYSKKYAARWSK